LSTLIESRTSRERFSERLLEGSAKTSYEPIVDIDWDAALDPDKYYISPKFISLYGTPMWDAMTRAQRIDLSRQELVNTMSAAINFENMLNQALLRKLMHDDPSSRETRYALTELGDEARHMVMFGTFIEHVGATAVRLPLLFRMIANVIPLVLRGSILWVVALVGEEILDAIQRQTICDPDIQPIVQRVMRIHVTEEARHIQFARDGLRRRIQPMPRYKKWLLANIAWMVAFLFAAPFNSPVPYARAGLDARAALKQVRANPHFHEVRVSGFSPLATFLTEVGLMGPIARHGWKACKFL